MKITPSLIVISYLGLYFGVLSFYFVLQEIRKRQEILMLVVSWFITLYVFAVIYSALYKFAHDCFTVRQPIGQFDFFYFSGMMLILQSGIGYGDIIPSSWYTKLLCMMEVMLGIAIVVVLTGKYILGQIRGAPEKGMGVED